MGLILQFTCAAPSRVASVGDIADAAGGDIWVCNSDGYVGHFCLVSMVPEAQVCNAVYFYLFAVSFAYSQGNIKSDKFINMQLCSIASCTNVDSQACSF